MVIVKIGGGKDINLKGIAADLRNIDDSVVVVLGANSLRDDIAKKIDYEKKVITSISGYDSVFSDTNTIDLMMMVYSGLRSKRFVELCQQNGVNAFGFSGLDGKMIVGKRNSGIRIREDGKTKIIRDFSGKPASINVEMFNYFLTNKIIPVVTVPLIDENNFAINSENDDVVTLLHSELKADKIIQLIEAPGLLIDKNDPSTLIKEMSSKEMIDFENKVDGRMKRKIHAINKLFEAGDTELIITDGRLDNPLTNALNKIGTYIK
ncbi:MAG: acetylglutamate kinase [Ignavibacteriaceae bacterium]|jgi:acetylglutamate/LysW-gamma-L-alpha-aminoadipate kinase|nr:acetylglutamate kinase [Ignavibacteriaceae bacterium]